MTPLIASQNQLVDLQILCGPLETREHNPRVGFVRVSVWLCRVVSGSGTDFNFRVEIVFKVIVFKFSFGNKLCNKLSECWYLYYTFAFCSFKINSDSLLSVFDFTVPVNFFYSRYLLCNIKIVKFKL